MTSVEQRAGWEEQAGAGQPQRGTTSLTLGTAAVALMGCPFLPSSVSTWIRFLPVYLIVPLGICAIVTGLVALHRTRGRDAAHRIRARVGTALGTVAVVLPLAVVVWAVWALNQIYE